MTPGTTNKAIGACAGLSGFAIAVIAGIAADNPFDIVVSRALFALPICFTVGFILGTAGERVVQEVIASAEGAARARSKSSSGAPLPAPAQVKSR